MFFTESDEVPDFSGVRVASYINICKIYHHIYLLKVLLGGVYSRQTRSSRFVKFSREDWQTDNMISIFKSVNILKNTPILIKCRYFQYYVIKR